MAINLEGIVTWLKGWFYDKTEITGFLNNKANQSDLQTLQGTVTSLGETVAGKIDTAGTGLTKSGTTLNHSNSVTAQTSAVAKKIKYDGQGHITGTSTLYGSDIAVSSSDSTKINTALGNKANSVHIHSINDITLLQSELDDLDDRIGDLESIKAIEVVSTLPTASADTMNRLYIVSENSKINVYYTVQDGQTFEWHKMDTDILDDLSVAWNDITGKPSTFTPSSHNHEADEVYDVDYQLYSNLINIGLLSGNQQQNINRAIDTAIGSHDDTLQSLDTSISGKAPTSHSSSATTYGVGTTSNYGHNKIIDNLTSSTLTNGESLSAHQGYVLKGLVDAKQDEITSIVLVPKATDANGKIIFYTGDEPS